MCVLPSLLTNLQSKKKRGCHILYDFVLTWGCFNATELGRRSTLATAAAAPMASVCSPHTGLQIRLDSKDASAASASSAPSSICREDPLRATRGRARRGTTDGHGLFSVVLKKGKSFFLNTRFPAEFAFPLCPASYHFYVKHCFPRT